MNARRPRPRWTAAHTIARRTGLTGAVHVHGDCSANQRCHGRLSLTGIARKRRGAEKAQIIAPRLGLAGLATTRCSTILHSARPSS